MGKTALVPAAIMKTERLIQAVPIREGAGANGKDGCYVLLRNR